MLHTYFISLDASVTITENKSAELITETRVLKQLPKTRELKTTLWKKCWLI